MEKILVTLFVPAVNSKFDVLLPSFLKVQDVIPLLTEALSDLTQQRYVTSGAEVLCCYERSIIFDRTFTIEECGVRHGDKLYLF
jgi:hypothetical protein